jgi:PHD/YefM family antitoxin component YafN of YafNO toxin-antitoxin module
LQIGSSSRARVGLAVELAGDQPVVITDPQTNAAYVLLKADVYRRMREILEEEEDRREKDAWSKIGRKASSEWARESPY